MVPPVPVMVTVAAPVVAVLLAVRVRIELPLAGAVIEAGLKLAVTPEGKPVAESETAELNPPTTVVNTVAVLELPCATDKVVGETVRVKSGVAGALTLSEIVVVCVTLPPLAVIVMFTVPVVAVLEAVSVSVELPLPGAAKLVGLKLAVTPAGSPDADSDTAELNPPLSVVDTVAVAELPCVTLREAGVAVTLKSAVACFQTSEIGVALAAPPTLVSPYKSSRVRSTLK